MGCRKYFNIFGQTGNLYGGGLHPHPHPHHFSAENRPNELSPFCGMFDVFQLFFGYTMLRKQRFSREKKVSARAGMLCAPWYDKAQQSLWQPGIQKGMGPTQTPTHNFQKLYPCIWALCKVTTMNRTRNARVCLTIL